MNWKFGKVLKKQLNHSSVINTTFQEYNMPVLYNNYKRFSFLKDYNFSDEELQEMNKYYEMLLNNENVRLATTLYKTLPPQVKEKLDTHFVDPLDNKVKVNCIYQIWSKNNKSEKYKKIACL